MLAQHFIKPIIGTHYLKVHDEEDVLGKFTSAAQDCLFMFMDEIEKMMQTAQATSLARAARLSEAANHGGDTATAPRSTRT